MPENKFSSFTFTRSHGGSLSLATHIPASRRKKSLREEKVGFAEKNTPKAKPLAISRG